LTEQEHAVSCADVQTWGQSYEPSATHHYRLKRTLRSCLLTAISWIYLQLLTTLLK